MASEHTPIRTTAREKLSLLNKNVVVPLRRTVDTTLNPHVKGMAWAGVGLLAASFIPELAVASRFFRTAGILLEGTAIAQTANHRSLRRLNQSTV